MRQIDKVHLAWPFYSSRRVRNELRDRSYDDVSRGHVATLMRIMGVEAIYRKPRTSLLHSGHKTYPYLLKDLEINRANLAWAPSKETRPPLN
jgi:putative transposase